jgi:hypothetical protein
MKVVAISGTTGATTAFRLPEDALVWGLSASTQAVVSEDPQLTYANEVTTPPANNIYSAGRLFALVSATAQWFTQPVEISASSDLFANFKATGIIYIYYLPS